MALAIAPLRNLGFQGIRCSAVGSVENVRQQYREGSRDVTKSTSLTALKRGTGGRSSFSGVVATVFGSTGFLGRYLANKLGKIGTQIVFPYRGDYSDVTPLKLVGDLGQVLFLPFNLKDEESLYKAMKYSNVVINLIGRGYETSNYSFEDVNVTGARNLARIAKECGVKRFIHMSALNATENPKPFLLKSGSKFLASKWRGENAVREEFPEATIFRPSDMWGMEDQFLSYYASWWRKGLNQKVIPLYKKGKATVKQPVFVSDVAEGIVNSIFEESALGATYEAVGPRRYDLCEIVEWFHRIMLREPIDGYRITDIRFSPAFQLWVTMIPKFFTKYPRLYWEKVEREFMTDTVTYGTPTLEDLGVSLTKMEDQMHFHLKMYRALNTYDDKFGEFAPPAPPKLAVEDT